MRVIEEKICKTMQGYIDYLPARFQGETTLLKKLSYTGSGTTRDSICMTNGYLDYKLFGTVLARYDFTQNRILIYTGKYYSATPSSREKALLKYFTELSISKRNDSFCIDTISGTKTYRVGCIFECVYKFGHWHLHNVYSYNGALILD